MNKQLQDRRDRHRIPVKGTVILVAGDTTLPARLEDISFTGLRCRTEPGALQGLNGPVRAIRLEDLPDLQVTPQRIDGDVFAATYDNGKLARRVTAGFIARFVDQLG
jgi:hypothetical protein